MAIKEQEKATEQKLKDDQLVQSYQKQIEELQGELEDERNKAAELASVADEMKDLKRRIKSMEGMKEIYEEQMQSEKVYNIRVISNKRLSVLCVYTS
jgi:methylthioribose-1-phosphate isomerase